MLVPRPHASARYADLTTYFRTVPRPSQCGRLQRQGLRPQRARIHPRRNDRDPAAAGRPIPPGWPRRGERYEEDLAHDYARGFELNMQAEGLPHRDNSVDLDPVQKDEWPNRGHGFRIGWNG